MTQTARTEGEWRGVGERIMADARARAADSEAPDMMTRTYLTAAHHAAAQRLTAWMRAAGNVIGRYESTQPGAPALLTGSHLDTVRNSGIYDGNLGVLLPIA